jgi:hypothetical protein
MTKKTSNISLTNKKNDDSSFSYYRYRTRPASYYFIRTFIFLMLIGLFLLYKKYKTNNTLLIENI